MALFSVELEEDSPGVLRVNVGLQPALGAPHAPEWLDVVVADGVSRHVDVLHLEGHVVQAGPALFEEAIEEAVLAQRLQNADETFASMGAKLREVYLVMGAYDYIVIGEAPDDATMARVALAISGQGNVRTQSFRAFDRSETLKLVEGLP